MQIIIDWKTVAYAVIVVLLLYNLFVLIRAYVRRSAARKGIKEVKKKLAGVEKQIEEKKKELEERMKRMQKLARGEIPEEKKKE